MTKPAMQNERICIPPQPDFSLLSSLFNEQRTIPRVGPPCCRVELRRLKHSSREAPQKSTILRACHRECQDNTKFSFWISESPQTSEQNVSTNESNIIIEWMNGILLEIPREPWGIPRSRRRTPRNPRRIIEGSGFRVSG